MLDQSIKKKSKLDPELRKKMKEMESKTREQSSSFAPAYSEASKEEQMSFDQWWMIASKLTKLRPHYKEIIEADFKARGLGKLETKQRYDEALRVFGISV